MKPEDLIKTMQPQYPTIKATLLLAFQKPKIEPYTPFLPYIYLQVISSGQGLETGSEINKAFQWAHHEKKAWYLFSQDSEFHG